MRRFTLSDTRSRDDSAVRLSGKRRDLIAARIASHGGTDLGPWLVANGALTWCETDKTIALQQALAVSRECRDEVRYALCL